MWMFRIITVREELSERFLMNSEYAWKRWYYLRPKKSHQHKDLSGKEITRGWFRNAGKRFGLAGMEKDGMFPGTGQ
jgi:hypothetical protein